MINNPIIMHINYFEQGQSIEYVCRNAAKLGFDGIEFRRTGKNKSSEEYVGEIAKYANEYNIKYVLFGGPGIEMMTQDESKRKSEIESYKHFLDVASANLKLSVINFMTGWLNTRSASKYDEMGSFCAENWHWESAADGCQQVADYAVKIGSDVKFAFETHMGYVHDIAGSSKKLCDMIDRPNFGINLDYGNTVYFSNETIEQAIDNCGDKLFYTHMKNSAPVAGMAYPGRIPTSLSGGDINHRAYLNKLEAVGFDGLIGIEAPRPGDREWFAKEDLDYIKTVIADINFN